ncbi:hypothetical protein E2C01_093493 [Portunus trituberculatus]|uniref:Uncharacterized protein n=1 Tax=Portunus trituberculatus TaxID=210409 RepID=A0A5B7JMV3_PORTR|nr:hypothetical protein [Portunus trituberculatus]
MDAGLAVTFYGFTGNANGKRWCSGRLCGREAGLARVGEQVDFGVTINGFFNCQQLHRTSLGNGGSSFGDVEEKSMKRSCCWSG